jgi:hypothetical protein
MIKTLAIGWFALLPGLILWMVLETRSGPE